MGPQPSNRALRLARTGGLWVVGGALTAFCVMIGGIVAIAALLYLVPAEACESGGCWRNGLLARGVGFAGFAVAALISAVVPVAAWVSRIRVRPALVLLAVVGAVTVLWWVGADHLYRSAGRIE